MDDIIAFVGELRRRVAVRPGDRFLAQGGLAERISAGHSRDGSRQTGESGFRVRDLGRARRIRGKAGRRVMIWIGGSHHWRVTVVEQSSSDEWKLL